MALGPDSIANLGAWLTNYFKGFLGLGSETLEILRDSLIQIIIFWVGIGYAEEAILLVLYIKRCFGNSIKLIIIGIDLHQDVITFAKDMIEKYACEDSISIFLCDVLSINNNATILRGLVPHIVYTSAAAGNMFNLKLLTLCIQWRACLLCNWNTAQAVESVTNEKSVLLLKAWLHDSGMEEDEERNIFLVKFPHKCTTTETVFQFVCSEYIDTVTDLEVRNMTFFRQLILSIQDHVVSSKAFSEDVTLYLNETLFANFIESVNVSVADLQIIYTTYLSTDDDKKRQEAQVILSIVVLKTITDRMRPVIAQYFPKNHDLFSNDISNIACVDDEEENQGSMTPKSQISFSDLTPKSKQRAACLCGCDNDARGSHHFCSRCKGKMMVA